MIQEKLGLNGALKICKFWNNGALKNTLPRLKYNQERFEKVKLMKQWRLEPFYRRKKVKLTVWGSTSRARGRLVDQPLAFNTWQVIVGPQPDLNRLRFNLDREKKATWRERNFLASLNRSLIGWAQPVDWFLNRLSHFLAQQPTFST